MRDPKRGLEFITPPSSRLKVANRKLSFVSPSRQHMTEPGILGLRPIQALQHHIRSRLKKRLFPFRLAPKSPPSQNERRREVPNACKYALSAQAMRWMH